MKRILLSVFTITSMLASAQVNTELRINHRMGAQTFSANAEGQNNMGHDFKVDRLEYYLTRVTVVHDGGQTTSISDDTLALVNALDGFVTTVELGSLNITTVEDVKFHIGVYAPTNTSDPSVWPASHPLALQSPSMHWGWSSGYRFVAFEGNEGATFNQNFEMHGLGDNNYFETTVTGVTGVMDNGTLVIGVDADYEKAVENINLSSGPISHGFTGEAKTCLENFRDYVFSPSSQSVGVEEEEALVWTVYPNPSNEETVKINLAQNIDNYTVEVKNALGQLISTTNASGNAVEINVSDAGIYFVSVVKDGKTLATQKLVRE